MVFLFFFFFEKKRASVLSNDNDDFVELLTLVRIAKKGSLRDQLLGSSWQESAARKRRRPRRTARQRCSRTLLTSILATLRLLAHLHVPIAHFHAGNVLLDDDGRPLIDVSHVFDFAAPRYAGLQQRFRKRASPEVVAVGCALFELATGDELQRLSDIESVHDRDVRDVLVDIFAGSGDAPTLESLHERFSDGRRRVFRDATAPFDEAQVKMIDRANKYVRRIVKSGGTDSSTEASSVNGDDPETAIVDEKEGKPCKSAPRKKKKKKKWSESTSDTMSIVGEKDSIQ